MKKFFVLFLIAILTLTVFTSCSKKNADTPAKTEAPAPAVKEPVSQAPAAAPAKPAETAASTASAPAPENTPAISEYIPQDKPSEQVVTLNIAGSDVIVKVTNTAAEFTYPSAITEYDIRSFAAFVNANYADYVRGVSFGFTGNNRVLVTYPAEADVLNSLEKWEGLCKYVIDEYIASLNAKSKYTPAQQAALDATPAAPAPKEEKPVETKPATVTMISSQDAQAAIAASIPGMPTSVHNPEKAAETAAAAEAVIAGEAAKTSEYDLAPEGYVPFRHHVIGITADSNNFFSTSPFRIGVDAYYTYKFIPNLGVGGEIGWSDGTGFHLLAKLNADALITDFFGVSGGIGGGANLYTDNSFAGVVSAEGGFDFNISKLFGVTLKTGIRYYFANGAHSAQFEWRPFKVGVKVSL